MSNWHSMEVAQVTKELNTDPQEGLTEDEAKSRLEKYGYNELKKEKKVSGFSIFINQFKKYPYRYPPRRDRAFYAGRGSG